jgi:orotidine-5'-phosphate decarboxylase
MTAKDRLIFALDVNSRHEAEELAKKLAGHVGFFKVGLELFANEGPSVIRAITNLGGKVFLDLKLHDIPTTVERTALTASNLGVRFLTVHVAGGRRMLEAALRGAREGAGTGREAARILAVTLLTSLEESDLREIGLEGPTMAAGERLALLADRANCHGVIASPREAAPIRAACRQGFLIVTPGIRPAGSEVQDQARSDTPAAAIEAGADYLVVGRPIRDAADPAKAADQIVAEMEAALPKA